MKKTIILILIFLIVLSLNSQEKVDFILAKVGREIILFSDLVRQINQMQNAQMLNERISHIDILESMVENKLIVQKARELNIRVDDRRINSTLDLQMSQIRANFNSEEDFHRELRNSGLTVSELRQYYHDLFVEQFLRERLIQTEIRNKIRLSDQELHSFFIEEYDNLPQRGEGFRFAVILRVPGASEQTITEANERISEIKEMLNEGADFEELAKLYSECPSGSFGGDLGYFSKGMMVASFEETAFNLQLDEISEIVRTDFGYHIIQVTDIRDNEIQARHILILIEESDDDISREISFMESLKERAINGEDFAQLSVKYSTDESIKNNNGLVGPYIKEEFPPWFSEELSELKLNDMTNVLEHQNVLYIFKLTEIVEPRNLEFEEIKDQLRELLLSQRQFELYESWIESLKAEIFVDIFEERLDEISRN